MTGSQIRDCLMPGIGEGLWCQFKDLESPVLWCLGLFMAVVGAVLERINFESLKKAPASNLVYLLVVVLSRTALGSLSLALVPWPGVSHGLVFHTGADYCTVSIQC